MLAIIDDRNISPSFLQSMPDFGSGYNRSDGSSMLAADNDWDVVLEFLREYSDTSNTYRSYCKELERFCLWLIHVLETGISHLKRPDWLTYIAFMQDPQPVELWAGNKQKKFNKDGSQNDGWRPYQRRIVKIPTDIDQYEEQEITGLGPSSINKAKKIIESFYSYLVENGYLNGNPVLARRKRQQAAISNHRVKQRFLEEELIDYTVNILFALQCSTEQDAFSYIRARYIILLLANTGLRIEESASHTMGHIYQRNKRWFLGIIGKGGKPRDIELLPDFMASLSEFRLDAGLSTPVPMHNESTPLIPRQNLSDSISARRIDQILSWAFKLASSHMREDAKRISHSNNEQYSTLLHQASKLEAASAHWLRHSHATYFLAKTNNLKAVMERLGHADVSTTMIYQHVVDELV